MHRIQHDAPPQAKFHHEKSTSTEVKNMEYRQKPMHIIHQIMHQTTQKKPMCEKIQNTHVRMATTVHRLIVRLRHSTYDYDELHTFTYKQPHTHINPYASSEHTYYASVRSRQSHKNHRNPCPTLRSRVTYQTLATEPCTIFRPHDLQSQAVAASTRFF